MSNPSPVPRDASDHLAPWRQSLREAIRTLPELLKVVELDGESVAAFQPSADEFALLVPRSFAARMKKGDPNDPLLRQILPDARERFEVDGYGCDPLAETELARRGVLEKYAGRALLVVTGACPIHCRYCFRRHFPYNEQLASRRQWAPALERLRRTQDLSEVILSGGDPLSLSNRNLAELVAEIEQLPLVHTLRIHTRFPIILPERVDSGLLELLAGTRLKTVLVVHCNHANEINGPVKDGLLALRSAGSLMLNQSVLLRGINDTCQALEALSHALFDCGVLPYYLHLLDPVAGAAHFDASESHGRELTTALRQRLPGYLVPRLVREEPGASSKTVLA